LREFGRNVGRVHEIKLKTFNNLLASWAGGFALTTLEAFSDRIENAISTA
jgi:hypothetical protein